MPNRALLATNICRGSVSEYYPLYCIDSKRVCRNIINSSHLFDTIFFINDFHKNNDKEFRYLPPHMIEGSSECYRLINLENQLKCKSFYFLKKDTFSGIKSEHNKKIIEQYRNYQFFIGGFALETDVIHTIFDLIYILDHNIKILTDCVSGTTKDKIKESLSIMFWTGVERVNTQQI